MENEEILKGNKLICDFIGLRWHDNDTISTYPTVLKMVMGVDKLQNCKWHCDWNWMMLLLDRIEVECQTGGAAHYYWNDHEDIRIFRVDILTAWVEAVKFIKWSNSLSKTDK